MQNAYHSHNIPLWVTHNEIYFAMQAARYSMDIIIELSEWIARRNSMCYAAGFLNHKPLIINVADVKRMLVKMKYSPIRVDELSAMITDSADALYKKGRQHGGHLSPSRSTSCLQ